ncbi:CRISPR-associated protein, Cas2 family [Alkalithermobacter thermoalcaliphilus JW-YL-7 = DSM 7308]|uniref:CRISPR-associated endoribonuclease Cas2 n=1 Tax=Alkalithermobacter thermoalcaliphilus JW-YL-7 = DSM 7308 TaxID=1121328 RepID=A0A150FQS5_CLOPD|nr:CRISPR associated protein Cas2 [[Clostridium] paradoxum JW-YL-7 = DSM 7308]SHL30053.1 CRISPR-associated protein, Cas2 family [[Clostridium] paradoxum JW-YL-7 = DSM 7308]
MYIILTYDVEIKRVNKVRKHLKKYLTWTQNSVFEGEITEGRLHKCLNEIEKIVNKDEDSVYIYRVNTQKFIKKEVIGKTKSFDDMFL